MLFNENRRSLLASNDLAKVDYGLIRVSMKCLMPAEVSNPAAFDATDALQEALAQAMDQGLVADAVFAKSERDRQSAEQSRDRGHHDGPESELAACVDGFPRTLAFHALGFERKVDHHDRVLLDHAEKHDESDEGVEIQFPVKQLQGKQCAENGRRQARQNRNRVDEALVQNAQHDVYH